MPWAAAPDSRRNLLDRRCRNAYKSAFKTKGTSVRNFATSLILVSKRTAGGG
jgi:hypothetical protein